VSRFCRCRLGADSLRANIGNARAAGLVGPFTCKLNIQQKDLGLSNRQYSIALTVTYIPYIVAELPLTLAMKKV
jgi:hypothetical protein